MEGGERGEHGAGVCVIYVKEDDLGGRREGGKHRGWVCFIKP